MDVRESCYARGEALDILKNLLQQSTQVFSSSIALIHDKATFQRQV